MANTDVGKSSFAVAVGLSAVEYGKNVIVLHVVTEDVVKDVENKYFANLSRVERYKFLNPKKLSKQEREVIDRVRSHSLDRSHLTDRIFVQQMEPGSSVEGLRGMVLALRERFPDNPILLVLDSGDHLKPADKMENFRLGASEVYWTLKSIVMDPVNAPIAAFGTVQAAKAFAGKSLKAEAVGESYDKARIATLIIGLSDSNDEVADVTINPTGRVIDISVVKNKLGPKKFASHPCECNLGLCVFDYEDRNQPPDVEVEDDE